jgi:hypothetical protein
MLSDLADGRQMPKFGLDRRLCNLSFFRQTAAGKEIGVVGNLARGLHLKT